MAQAAALLELFPKGYMATLLALISTHAEEVQLVSVAEMVYFVAPSSFKVINFPALAVTFPEVAQAAALLELFPKGWHDKIHHRVSGSDGVFCRAILFEGN